MRKKPSFLFICLLILTLLGFPSCSTGRLYSEGSGNLQVVCTTFVPFDFARMIGGDRVTVTILQDSGADLHNYTPTSATLTALAEADVFIYIGGESDEKWVPDALGVCENPDLITVCLMDCIEEPLHASLENDWSSHAHKEDDHSHEGHAHHADEHIWASPRNAKAMVSAICDALCQADTAGAEVYRSAAAAYVLLLDELDTAYSEAVNSAAHRSVVVADRFPLIYLFHDYKIAYIAAFSGCSTEVNASFETQVKLIEAVKSQKLSCILTIEGTQKDLAEAVADETGCKILTLNSLQSVKRNDIENGAAYLDIMWQNLSVLKEALSIWH